MQPKKSLFANLRHECRDDWQRYISHPFVAGIQNGTLAIESFRHYLIQDYLFLVHFARAFGLAAYKAQTIDQIQIAGKSLHAITEIEMGLHIEFCKHWGISEQEMCDAPEEKETIAYTRYVLERGMSGDLLDLYVAMSPCICGYAEIGTRLKNDPSTCIDGNPYTAWINMYASDEIQDEMTENIKTIDKLFSLLGGDARITNLTKTFIHATQLETNFWEMGLSKAHY